MARKNRTPEEKPVGKRSENFCRWLNFAGRGDFAERLTQTVLTFCSGSIGILIRRVRSGFQRRTVRGQQPVAPEFLLRTELLREAVKQIFERGWKQLLPLLDESRCRWRINSPAEMPKQPLPDALFIHGENEIDQHVRRQHPFSGKITTRLPRVPFRVFPEPSDDGKEPLPQCQNRVFHVQPS